MDNPSPNNYRSPRRPAMTPLNRSENMARIKSRDTAPERLLRQILRKAELRFRAHPALFGAPDLGFIRGRVLIFLDGCFWHGCPEHYIAPNTRYEFWAEKLRKNAERDTAVEKVLAKNSWLVVRLWQHELVNPDHIVLRIQMALKGEAHSVPPLFPGSSRWWRCICSSVDAQVIETDGAGSLKPGGSKRPIAATFRCRECGLKRRLTVPKDLS